MRARRVWIHHSACSSTLFDSKIVNVVNLIKRLHLMSLHICDINHACVRIFSYLQLLSLLPGLFQLLSFICEQIVKLVEIQLDHIALESHCKSLILLISLFQLEEFREGSWNDTWILRSSLNRVCFSGSRLPIGKETNIVSINSTLHQHFGVLKDLLLWSPFPKTSIKSVFFFLVAETRTAWTCSSLLFDFDFECILVRNRDNRQRTELLFSITHGSHSTKDPNFAFHVLDLVVKSFPYYSFVFIFHADSISLVSQLLIVLHQKLLTQFTFSFKLLKLVS